MKITEQLTRKLGPLPVWAWGGLAAAGVLIYRQFQRAQQPPTENLGMGLGMGGGYGTPVGLPASDPITGQPAYGENLYLSMPYGEGYLSVEGGAGAVQSLLGLIPWWTPESPGQMQPAPGYPYGGGALPELAAPSPVTITAGGYPISAYSPTQQIQLQAAADYGLYTPGIFAAGGIPGTEAPLMYEYISPAVAGAPAQTLYKPLENVLNMPQTQCGPGYYAKLGAFNPATGGYDFDCVPL